MKKSSLAVDVNGILRTLLWKCSGQAVFWRSSLQCFSPSVCSIPHSGLHILFPVPKYLKARRGFEGASALPNVWLGLNIVLRKQWDDSCFFFLFQLHRYTYVSCCAGCVVLGILTVPITYLFSYYEYVLNIRWVIVLVLIIYWIQFLNTKSYIL